ncbi:PREDICTED: orofacial cleft 1 candidate gene 1 protein [Miniopterus natalensis]|uniref:orofacial cleft 1 candidate gene 1 protein n=1 Tax=Miniopterus natalensis TaxID=291302 RepID=UPI0007A6AED0|nr:PREDICTED: orofacial cleft 1 candidate gene 1 protein [Miniopterus natalensis]
MDREKFQQKALKQAEQKKSKSAEFLMVKEDREAMEGTGNPAFNMSSPDLSAYQTSEKKVIRRDVPDRTLAAHQQKCRLPASAEPKGNEHSRNYFDPLMHEEINPRQCGMEVSREVDSRILYDDRLMRMFDENGRGGVQDESIEKAPLGSEEPMSSRKSPELHKGDSEATSAYSEEFKRYAQKDIIWRGSSSLKQDLKSEGEELNQYIPMSCLKTDKTFEKAPRPPLAAELTVCTGDRAPGPPGAAGPCWKGLLEKQTFSRSSVFLSRILEAIGIPQNCVRCPRLGSH